MTTTSPVVLSGSDFGGLTVDWPDNQPTQAVQFEGAIYEYARLREPDRFGDLMPTNQAVFIGLRRPDPST